MDISAWLRELGLERYEQAFRENEVGLDVLPKLTGEDLKEIGVIPVGDRRRLLVAIAVLARESEPAPQQAARDVVESPPESAEAERRQLTVLFCDLVGSTELSGKLDPEDMREVIRDYQNAVAGEIARFEGHVAKYMGDGVLAYFGYPKAHEDEAERAVRAGLALAETIGPMKAPTGEPLAVRVGIATGLVVVGDLVGEGTAQEQAVVGDTPNLAARLQTTAGAGQVVIADATRRLLGAGFELEDLGNRKLKGVSRPVQAFAVGGERPVESRFEARSGPLLLPMVGRDQELALLLDRWAQAKAGEGQGALLVGEAGIGKSRIGRALLDAVANEPHTPIRYQCSPYHIDSALRPVIQQLSHAAGLGADDPLDARLDKLEALLAQAGGRDAAPLIADLIGLDGTARYGELGLTPQVQRTRTLEALVGRLLGLAAREPVLVVLEDAHWIDPTTLELIEQCLDRIADARVLLLLTSRPDQQPELATHPYVTRLTLNRLGRSGVEAIVARLGGDCLPTEAIDAIIARTDGVPLFVEELTKAVLETGEASIPASLHDSLMARLDRIPKVKEVAQTAACIGREFSHDLLAEITSLGDDQLQDALLQLVSSELVFRRGAAPEATYIFKHALVQDAAYQSLLKSRRQQLHARIASALEVRFADITQNTPEVVAHHCTQADLHNEAVRYWIMAGQRAGERSANAEAVAHLKKGLELIEGQAESGDRNLMELELLTLLGSVLIAIEGHGSREVGAIYARARDLSQQSEDSAHLAAVLQGLRVHHLVRGDWKLARKAGEELLAFAESVADSGYLVEAHRAIGLTRFCLGEFAAARAHLERGVAHYDPEKHRSHVYRYDNDPGMTCLSYLAKSLWYLGYPHQALERGEEAWAVGQASSHVGSMAEAMNWRAELAVLRRDARSALEWAEATLTLTTEQGFPAWVIAEVGTKLGWALAEQDERTAGIARMRASLEDYRAQGALLWQRHYLGLLAETHLKAGEIDEGLGAVTQAVGCGGATLWDAELHRIKGELLLQQDRPDPAMAESCFEAALEVARRQLAKSLELRAATSLARLWAQQGRRHQAGDLLGPVYDWFTEGFDTRDLKDAKALLDSWR